MCFQHKSFRFKPTKGWLIKAYSDSDYASDRTKPEEAYVDILSTFVECQFHEKAKE